MIDFLYEIPLKRLKMSRGDTLVITFVLALVISLVFGFSYDKQPFAYDDLELDDQDIGAYGLKEIRSKPLLGVKTLERILWPFSREYASVLDTLAIDPRGGISNTECGQSLVIIADGIRKKRLNSFKMLDASARGRSGLLASGLNNDIGDTQACLEDQEIQGKQCILTISVVDADLTGVQISPVERELRKIGTFNFGICIPITCDPVNIELGIQKHIRLTELNVTMNKNCIAKQMPQVQSVPMSLFAIACLVIVAIVIVVGSYLDVKPRQQVDTKLISTVLKNFSVFRNNVKLFSNFEDNTNRNLYFIHGARVSFVLVSVWLNAWSFKSLFISSPINPNAAQVDELEPHVRAVVQNLNQFALQANDFMFIISGILVVYTWLPQIEKGPKVTFTRYVLTRWSRTIPTVGGIVLLSFLLQTVSNQCLCPKNVWSSLLYLNNWMSPKNSCLPAIWYLSIDFQLYLLSYLPLRVLARHTKAGLYLIGLFAVIGLLVPGFMSTYHGDFDEITTLQGNVQFINYFATYCHLTSFSIGLFLGFCLIKNIRHSSQRVWTFGWLLVTLVNISTVLASHYVNFEGHDIWRVVFKQWYRLTGIAFYSWTCYYLANNRSSILQNIFSRRLYVPLSRMAFSIYTSQFLAIVLDMSLSQRELRPLSFYGLISKTCYLTMVCIFFGYIVYIAFEAPTVALLKVAITTKPLAKDTSEQTMKKKTRLMNNNFKGLPNVLEISSYRKQL